MTGIITLTIAGSMTGPFNLYSNIDGYLSAFDTSISRQQLLDGFATVNIPDGTTTIRVMSQGACFNYLELTMPPATTTTTTSTSSTTTTTTTAPTLCRNYTIGSSAETGQFYSYTDCNGIEQTGSVGGVGGIDIQNVCALQNSVIITGSQTTLFDSGPC